MTEDEQRRRQEAFLRRNRSVRQQLLQAGFRPDENVDNTPVTNFGKALKHDKDGIPTQAAYESLLEALEEGSVEALNGILREEGDGRPRRLVQPHASQSFQKAGADPQMLQIRPHPAFDSDQTGAEMVELYWRALARDVPYGNYNGHSTITNAVSELSGIPGYQGSGGSADPRSDGLDSSSLFRGVIPGAQRGPRISQFLWKDVPRGAVPLSQRIRVLTGANVSQEFHSGSTTLTLEGPDYLTDFDDWLAVQSGVPVGDVNPPPNLVDKGGDADAQVSRHIIKGRDLANKVRRQVPYLSIRDAAEILLGMDVPKDPNIPYKQSRPSETDGISGLEATRPFLDFGSNDILDIVVNVFMAGQNVCWYRKWQVHRRLRPEEYGGRIHAQRNRGRSFPIPENVLNSEALSRIEGTYGTSLLPQAYTEGSPTHPSFPAGHSGVAGATVTVLKAMFDGTHEFSNDELVVPTQSGSLDGVDLAHGGSANGVIQTELSTIADESGGSGGTTAATQAEIDEAANNSVTVNDELNKLATNMAFGRNWAGIHYRTDGIDGFLVGEQAAVRYLQDHIRHHDLPFDGYRLQPFFDRYPGTLDGAQPNLSGGEILITPNSIEDTGGMAEVDDPPSE